MGLFDKFRKPKGKRNEIELDNKELKEDIANAALSILKPGAQYDSLENTIVEFGYLFTFEGHGVEALLKVTTDKSVFYFAVQKTSVIPLEFNEAFFKDTTEQFLTIHS